MTPKLSVLLPIFQPTSFLANCLTSLEQQTYPNLEIIILSTTKDEETKKILRKYKKQSQFSIYENETYQGAANARNYLLSLAQGEYIHFLDSRGELPKTFYESMLSVLEKENSQVIICDFQTKNEIGQEKYFSCTAKSLLTFLKNPTIGILGNKIFAKECIHIHPFASDSIREDISTVIPVLLNASSLSYVENTTYTYHKKTPNQIKLETTLIKDIDLAFLRIAGSPYQTYLEETIIYNYLIINFIKSLTKVHGSKRRQLIKKFVQATKKYNIDENKYFQEFLNNQSKIYRLYYQYLFKLAYHHSSYLTNFLITIANTYKSKSRVIKKPITLKDIIKLAKKQSKLSSNLKTISVIVPNYNYERFLYERIYSILYQQMKIDELIILDDCSTDNSKDKIIKIVEAIKPYINVTYSFNDTNSGSAYKAWYKGYNLASKDYVWIAEADDYCHPKFLKKIFQKIKRNNDIVIAYTATAHITKNGSYINRIDNNLKKTEHWQKDYLSDGEEEFQKYFYLNCPIANISSVVIKKSDYADYFLESENLKQVGDWLLYTNILKHGQIAYINKELNYYRLHGDNFINDNKKLERLADIEKIYHLFQTKYQLTKEQISNQETRIKELQKQWEL